MATSLQDAWRDLSVETDALVAAGVFSAGEIKALLGSVRGTSAESLPGVTREALRWSVQVRQDSEFLDMALRGLVTIDFDETGKMAFVLTDLGRRLRGVIPSPPNKTQH